MNCQREATSSECGDGEAMRGDKRKVKRHRMRHDAWLIFEDGKRSSCIWTDISDRGACIRIPDSQDVPDNFMLLLAEGGSPRRRCRVIWRRPYELGVKFETRLGELVRAAKSGVQAASKEAEPAESEA